jgi:hypothetical protein
MAVFKILATKCMAGQAVSNRPTGLMVLPRMEHSVSFIFLRKQTLIVKLQKFLKQD